MKQLCLFIKIILLKIILNHPNNYINIPKVQSLPYFYKKLNQKREKIKIFKKPRIRYLHEYNETSNISFYNESVIPSPPSDAAEMNIPLHFYGIDNFRANVATSNIQVFSWYTYFKYYSRRKPITLTYTIYIITFNETTLEEKTIVKDASCLLMDDKIYFLQYECVVELDNEGTITDIKKISMAPVFTFDGEIQEIEQILFYEEGCSEMDNIMEQKEDQYTILFNNASNILFFESESLVINSTEKSFYLNNLKLFKDNILADDIIGKYTFNIFNQHQNKRENVSCLLKNDEDGQKYNLECNVTMGFVANINNAIGYGSDINNKNNVIIIETMNDFFEIGNNTDEQEANSNSNNYTNKINLFLYGIGGFKNLNKTGEISWFTYFRYYSVTKKPKIFTTLIYISIKVRRLEEKIIKKKVGCTLRADTNGFFKFECRTKLPNEANLSHIETISIDPVFLFNVDYQEIKINSEPNSGIDNIIKHKEDRFEALVKESTYLYFLNSGILDTETDQSKFYIHKMQLLKNNKNNILRELNGDTKTKNYRFTFFNEHRTKNKSEYVNCELKNNGETYDLECKPSLPFSAHVNHGMGYDIDMGNRTNIAIIEKEEDYVLLEEIVKTKRSYYKNNINRLSGGIIVAIILICAAVLIIVILMIFMMKKNVKGHIPQASLSSSTNVREM